VNTAVPPGVVTRWPAPAKLNLFLHIVGRRPDGYHELQTVFQLLDFGDEIGIEPTDDGEVVRLTGPAEVAPDDDLAVRAARALRVASGSKRGARLHVRKRIPLGGGLGCGSADAATVLLALNHLWQTGLSRTELRQLGLQLGADVPVFVFGRSAFAQGVGEVLEPWTPAPASYVVLTPPVHVSTPAIFAHPGLTRDTPAVTIAALSEGFGHNDLEPIACGLNPEVAAYLGWLKQWGDARMTGSGACVFAAFPDRATAEQVFARRTGPMSGFVAEGVDQHPLYGFAD